jgi:hypothetical protein
MAKTASSKIIDELCRQTLEQAMSQRLEDLRSWLKETAPECFIEQRHTIEGSSERVYWHYGYMIAMRDSLAFLERKTKKLN